jgi:hypothetical protein
MILNAVQALEIGEALVDAAMDTLKYGHEHVVATICGDNVAISMPKDDSLIEFGYEPVFTVKT